MQVVETLTSEDLELFKSVMLDYEAAECSPRDLTFERAREIRVRYLEVQTELHFRYQLDESEEITISAITGEVMYGVD